MTDEIVSAISKYARLISELPYPAGRAPRILFKHDGRCYMTAKEADISRITEEDVIDVTDHDMNQLPAAAALMGSKSLGAVILCLPPYVDICLASRHEIPAVLDDMAQIIGPCVRIVPADEKMISKALTKATSVMVENSCLIAGGRNLYEAYTALTVIEKSAETILKAQVIGGVKPLKGYLSRLMHRRYQASYSKVEKALQDRAESGEEELPEVSVHEEYSEKELELRTKLVEYGRKLVEYGLVQGTWGNLSVMLDRENMLCTPSGLDYGRLTPEDMVKVNIRTLKWEGLHKPTSEKGMHAGIYIKYPEANAVIHTHSKYCSVFAAGEMPLQVESEEKIQKLGEIIGVSRYALAGTNGITRNAVRAIKDAPGCILSHHGMIAKGKDIEDAFENVRLIEEAARECIDRRWEK